MVPRADGDVLACEDIGSEDDSMVSLRLIVRNFGFDAGFPYRVRDRAAVEESGIRPVGRSPRAGTDLPSDGAARAARKYLERRLRR